LTIKTDRLKAELQTSSLTIKTDRLKAELQTSSLFQGVASVVNDSCRYFLRKAGASGGSISLK
jgi:hypothetical protein